MDCTQVRGTYRSFSPPESPAELRNSSLCFYSQLMLICSWGEVPKKFRNHSLNKRGGSVFFFNHCAIWQLFILMCTYYQWGSLPESCQGFLGVHTPFQTKALLQILCTALVFPSIHTRNTHSFTDANFVRSHFCRRRSSKK